MSKVNLKTVLNNRVGRWLIFLLACTLLFSLVPLFHLAPLSQDQNQSAEFNAAKYAEEFWQGPLLSATQNAVEIGHLLEAINKNQQDAAQQYGHRLGLSSSIFYLLQGSGSVQTKTEDSLIISLQNNSGKILIEIGPIFSNAVRDASGLLDVSQFANTQEFNAISSAINLKIEREVFPKLKNFELNLGDEIKFSGAIELPESTTPPDTLKLIPVTIEQL